MVVKTIFSYLKEMLAATYAHYIQDANVELIVQINNEEEEVLQPLLPIYESSEIDIENKNILDLIEENTIQRETLTDIFLDLERDGFRNCEINDLKGHLKFMKLTVKDGQLCKDNSDNLYYYTIKSQTPRSGMHLNGRLIQEMWFDVYGTTRHPTQNDRFLYTNVISKNPKCYIATQGDKTSFRLDDINYQFVIRLLKVLLDVNKERKSEKTKKVENHNAVVAKVKRDIDSSFMNQAKCYKEEDLGCLRLDLLAKQKSSDRTWIYEVKSGKFSLAHIGQLLNYYLYSQFLGIPTQKQILVIKQLRREDVPEDIQEFLEYLIECVPGFNPYIVTLQKHTDFLQLKRHIKRIVAE
ncbi:hypothetical protein [Sutcliffiella horikoshii]|uniref:hypothetical protein n=1 Tax=Sutcliffiella horikoshii TaxID=79883 RepID=UPI00384F9403